MAEGAPRRGAHEGSLNYEPPASNRPDIGRVNPNFLINREVDEEQQSVVQLFDRRGAVATLNSKLSISFQGKLYGKIDVTAKRPSDLNQGSEQWKSFVQELQFISNDCCHWHYHPHILQHHGLVFLKDTRGQHSIPYLLSEPVSWNLQVVLEDNQVKLSQSNKVSLIRDIAAGLNFLHSRKPRAIIHAALVPSSVLLNSKVDPKLTNFFHAGLINEPLFIVSQQHKPSKYKVGMKLKLSLDMSSLGYIIKAIDTEHRNRERGTGRNVLKELYVLFDSVEGPPEGLNAAEVCRKLTLYLESPPQVQTQDTQGQQRGPQSSVSLD